MKTKQILFSLALFLSVACIKAQDKYEFMIIAYFPQANNIIVAIDGKEVLHESVSVDKYEKVSGHALLKKIGEYQDKNWEVITFTNSIHSYQSGSDQEFYAYLKKKK